MKVIIYEIPRYGGHHFSLGFYSSEQVKNNINKPMWVEDLYEKQTLPDLVIFLGRLLCICVVCQMLIFDLIHGIQDIVILAINSAAAAKLFSEELICPKGSTFSFRVLCM